MAPPAQPPAVNQIETPKPQTFSHADFDTLLKKYVLGSGVKYREWSTNAEDKAALQAYLKRLSEAKPDAWSESEQKAFWINAYNALTLESVLERYPLKSVNYDALRDEKAKQFWEKPFSVGGGQNSLNQIENTILRPKFKDARIHFAINCASVGCPNLQPSAFTASDLDIRLDSATKEYLNDATKGVKWDKTKGILAVSQIFQWYKEDFGPDTTAFIKRFRPDITETKNGLGYFIYDWALNEAAASPEAKP